MLNQALATQQDLPPSKGPAQRESAFSKHS